MLKKIKIILAVVLPIVLVVGGSGYYLAGYHSVEKTHLEIKDISMGEKVARYHNINSAYQNRLKSDYDGIFNYWENLWKSHHIYNFTENLEYQGIKYANISVSIYPKTLDESYHSFLVNITYNGFHGNLTKFTEYYVGYNLPEVQTQRYDADISLSPDVDKSSSVISLDRNSTINYTTWLKNDGVYYVSPNSFVCLFGPWDNLTYNITTNTKNLRIYSSAYILFNYINVSYLLDYAHIPLKFGFWIREGRNVLDFSTIVNFEIIPQEDIPSLPTPNVNITKIGEREVKLEIQPPYNYTNIYVFWMDGSYTITKSKVVWHNYTKPGKYPIMVFYSYNGSGKIPVEVPVRPNANSYKTCYVLFKGLELSYIWNDLSNVEVNIG